MPDRSVQPDLRRIDTVLFDKDGTLLDFDATFGRATAKVIADLVNAHGGEAERVAAALGFRPDGETFEATSVVLAGSLEDIADEVRPLLSAPPERLSERIDERYRQHTEHDLRLIEDVLTMLDRLGARGVQLGIVTNDTQATAAHQLGILGIAERFGAIVGCDSGHGAKPSGGGVRAAMEMLGGTARRTLMVGDSARDCAAARDAGVFAVAVLTGHEDGDRLRAMADLTLPSAAALADVLEGAET